jgi:U6 snRNA-associated Sm-like protein LSm2
MLFLHVFHTLQGKEVIVHAKNGIVISGILESVDQFYNFKLINTKTLDSADIPLADSLKTAFIRGSNILYVELPAKDVDLDLLHDATRREGE